jgi:prepilin signal peptidase PulO-like enzyme (type II secretory pathway)
VIIEALRWIGERFTVQDYLFWTRLQGTAWTAADFVIVYYALRIANLCRSLLGRRPHRFPYVILAATVPPALLIPFVSGGWTFFHIELLVTVPHFLLILFVVAANARVAPAALSTLVTAAGTVESPCGRREVISRCGSPR